MPVAVVISTNCDMQDSACLYIHVYTWNLYSIILFQSSIVEGDTECSSTVLGDASTILHVGRKM